MDNERVFAIRLLYMWRPLAPLTVTEGERETLQRWVQRRTTAQALAQRARLILAAADGASNQTLVARMHLPPLTVSKWRRRFAAARLDGLLDEPCPGAPRAIGDAEVERVITITLVRRPEYATHWSTRSMAAHAGLGQSAIIRIWRAFGLQPHRTDTLKLSHDPLFIEKVRDIVGLYLNPPDKALVLAVDEKSQIQALNSTQPLLPMRPGQIERRTHGYRRHGTTSLFAALDVKTGEVLGRCHRRPRSVEFRRFVTQIEAHVPPELDIELIIDYYGTHNHWHWRSSSRQADTRK